MYLWDSKLETIIIISKGNMVAPSGVPRKPLYLVSGNSNKTPSGVRVVYNLYAQSVPALELTAVTVR